MNTAITKMRSSPHTLSSGATTGSQIFHTCCWLYLFAFFVLPDGFGFRLGVIWSAKRIMFFICYAQILFNRKRLTEFWNDVKTLKGPNIFIGLYLFVRLYTAVYRMDIPCITNSLLDEVLVFYLFCYLLMSKNVTIPELLHFLKVVLLVLCLEGLWEAATGINLFGFLNWAGEDRWGTYVVRGGVLSRVMGNCRHSINFGIYLSMLFFLSCVDLEKNKLYLFRSPSLFLLTTVCVFLTGSRAPLGIYVMCLFLICLFSNKDERIKSLIILLAVISGLVLLTMIVYRTEMGHKIMLMVTNIWDVLFDTRYADNWGGTAIGSTEYREALAKVFQLDYFNKIMGRGASYNLSVVIDGYWLRSCDNTYVMTYISYAYPGIAVLIGHGLTMAGYAIQGMAKLKRSLCGAVLVITICYFINIWYVAQMGLSIYMWMLFALVYVCCQNEKISTKKEVLA